MHALDLVAAVLVALGAFLGARRGLWRTLAGGVAVALGMAAAVAASGVLAAALGDLGVAYPGDVLLGLFLPFALVSVYARYIAGLWLSKRLARRPGRNRTLGAAAGVVWVVFALGFAARAAGLGPRRDRCGDADRQTGAGPATAAPFCSWLARYPGGVALPGPGKVLRPGRPVGGRGERTWEEALRAAVDGRRVQARAAEADREASASIREAVSPREKEGAREPGLKSVRLSTP